MRCELLGFSEGAVHSLCKFWVLLSLILVVVSCLALSHLSHAALICYLPQGLGKHEWTLAFLSLPQLSARWVSLVSANASASLDSCSVSSAQETTGPAWAPPPCPAAWRL